MSEEKTSVSLPPSNLWPHLAKISIVEDKPIMLGLLGRFFRKKSCYWS